ncbi:MAG: oligosaccharide flippase family protein [Endomicrobium sp.]|jgi:PST family polysaccharide transporter|nr:oligosaccharide flippase family protein [Endomicrobium sp.]
MEIKNFPAYDKRKKRLFKNWYYLTLLQAAQYIIPFIPIPYLVRVLSPDKFGLVAFAIAVSQFFAVFVEYGFSYSAVKRIAINKSDNNKITEIYSTTIIIKALIFLAMAAVFVPVLLFVPKISGEKLVFGFAFLTVFSDIFFTAWFFQGLEKMRYIAYLNLIMGTLYVVSVFVFIRTADDYYLVPLLESLSSLIIGVVSVWIIYKVFGVKFKFQPFERIVYYFKRGWHYFVSDFASNAYMSASVFILGFIANNAAVGYYRAALSILIPVKSLFEPVVHAAYPYMSKVAKESKEKAVAFLRTYSLSVAAVSLLLSAKLFFGAELIVKVFLGPEYAASAVLVKIISAVPFLYTLNMIFSMHVMYPFEMKANFAKITAFSAIISFALIPVLALPFKDTGMSVIMVIGELYISVMAFRHIKAKGFIFSKNV